LRVRRGGGLWTEGKGHHLSGDGVAAVLGVGGGGLGGGEWVAWRHAAHEVGAWVGGADQRWVIAIEKKIDYQLHYQLLLY